MIDTVDEGRKVRALAKAPISKILQAFDHYASSLYQLPFLSALWQAPVPRSEITSIRVSQMVLCSQLFSTIRAFFAAEQILLDAINHLQENQPKKNQGERDEKIPCSKSDLPVDLHF